MRSMEWATSETAEEWSERVLLHWEKVQADHERRLADSIPNVFDGIQEDLREGLPIKHRCGGQQINPLDHEKVPFGYSLLC